VQEGHASIQANLKKGFSRLWLVLHRGCTWNDRKRFNASRNNHVKMHAARGPRARSVLSSSPVNSGHGLRCRSHHAVCTVAPDVSEETRMDAGGARIPVESICPEASWIATSYLLRVLGDLCTPILNMARCGVRLCTAMRPPLRPATSVQ